MARLPESARMAEKVPKTSGLAFPNARNVAPATFSSSPRNWAIVARLGVKKSDADMPRVEKRKKSHRRRAENTNGRMLESEQKYICR